MDDVDFGDLEMTNFNKKGLNKKIHCEFQPVLDYLLLTLPSESSVLLLYSLLHTHPTFLDVILKNDYKLNGNEDNTSSSSSSTSSSSSSSRVRQLFTSLLRGLYDVENACSIDHLYLIVVCVLIMVQNSSLLPFISSIKTKADWYIERILQNITISDLIILCVLSVNKVTANGVSPECFKKRFAFT